MCIAAAIAGGAVAGVAGSAISAGASKSAANTQAQAAEDAAHLQNDQFNQTQANLQPYLNLGSSNINALQNALNNPIFNQQFSFDPFTAPTEAQAQATPGYQFTLNQGLKATQNSAAARGLGSSGAALKGAASYASGLADSTYNDVFSRALNTYNTNFNTASNVFNTNYNNAANQVNRLAGIVGSGQNAASGLGALGAQNSTSVSNTLTSGANASAAGTIGAANALSGGLNGVGNNALIYGLTQNNAAGAPSSAAMAAGSNGYGFTV